MKRRTFHFTLGPVQGFIAQARRTRDFWAGSFLLSWLSGVALLAVDSQEGSELVLPRFDPGYRRWLSSGGGIGGAEPPQQGLVPNRIKARVGESFDPKRVVTSVTTAWEALAKQVFNADLASHADETTRAIWMRQVQGFWETSWTLGGSDEHDLLDRRKNLRHALPADEPGLKCMMMDGWQELSGALSGDDRRPASHVHDFWASVRAQGRRGMMSDLRPGEHLCAIAFIKRRFARFFPELRVELPGGQHAHGWPLTIQVPSIGYIAAAPWLARFITAADRDDAEPHLSQLVHLGKRLGDMPAFNIPIKCVQHAVEAATAARHSLLRDVARLEGDLYFESNVANPRLYDDTEAARGFQETLNTARKMVGMGEPGRFFAVLRMDGDRVGAFLASGNANERDSRESAMAQALDAFAAEVAERIRAFDGWPIYAGGDDVLALLPAAHALDAALSLRHTFIACMRDHGLASTITISAAVLFAPIHAPLGRVLASSHDLLDDVAKERTGRDALAVQVLKPGGEHLVWSMPWSAAIAPPEEGGHLHLAAFARAMQASATNRWTSKFAFRVRELIAKLDRDEDGYALLPQLGTTPAHDDDLMETSWLLTAGVSDSSTNSLNTHDLQRQILAMLSQCRHVTRKIEHDSVHLERSACIREDAMLLARFLATQLSEA